MGPKKDVAGLWRQAALKQGLRFGVTEHLGASWGWYSVTKQRTKGPVAGVPYDGADPKYAELYYSGNEIVKPPYPAGWYRRIRPKPSSRPGSGG